MIYRFWIRSGVSKPCQMNLLALCFVSLLYFHYVLLARTSHISTCTINGFIVCIYVRFFIKGYRLFTHSPSSRTLSLLWIGSLILTHMAIANLQANSRQQKTLLIFNIQIGFYMSFRS